MQFARLVITALTLVSAGCTNPTLHNPELASREDFDSTSTHSRSFSAPATQTCEAARRALLSQGYVTSVATPELVTARKNFQPDSEVHVEVEFRVVCTPGSQGGSLVFVSALQDRYALKKVNNSASLGVGVLGSVSLPFSSSDDALVKVASETLGGAAFYDKFFRLVERYLPPPSAPPVVTGAEASAVR